MPIAGGDEVASQHKHVLRSHVHTYAHRGQRRVASPQGRTLETVAFTSLTGAPVHHFTLIATSNDVFTANYIDIRNAHLIVRFIACYV